MGNKHYGAIDGLRTLAALGVLMMHIKAFNDYQITGYVYETMIPSFTNFVFLFMTISAFSMCCGYYEKVLNGRISLSAFYGRRFQKILPFFTLLVLIDVVREPSASTLYEVFADLTLLFGFLQKPIEVIGVGWFLGLVFVFYLCFPFFCVLLENKRRAWLAFAVSLAYNWVCTSYFGVGRENILYSGCYFLAGGLIYLYREELAGLDPRLALGMTGCSIALYFLVGQKTILCLMASAALLVYAIGKRGGVLENRVTKFFSSISMEIYLCHMMFFRVVEKLGLNRKFGSGWMQYLITVVLVIAGAAAFAVIMQWVWGKVLKTAAAKDRTVCQR